MLSNRFSLQCSEFPRLLMLGCVLSLGLLLSAPGGAQEVSEPDSDGTAAADEAATAERPVYDITEAQGEIVVDGELDEAAWAEALVLTLDYETGPGENIPANVRTECHLTYDTRNLYIAFKAYDDDPEKIRARLTDRDRAFRDDFLGVALDTFNDERRAFEFFVNPFGVQMDLIYDDINSNEDSSWNGIWSSAGRLTDFGFQVEYAIPFSTLRFPRTSGVQTWGIDILRVRPRSFRQRLSVNKLEREVNCYLCQFSKIRGFEGISPGRNLEVTPTLTAARADVRDDFPSGPLVEGDEETDLGLTVSWGITPNLTLTSTVNPDFSQVEADSAQLDINNRFALFFPERRPFFLEAAELFDSPLDVVFTRNVADPSWGVKLTGKQGKNAVGVFVAEDEQTNLIFPGSQSSDADIFDFSTTDAVVRYRRDVGESSALGVLATSREGGGYSNGVVGVDGLFRVGSSHSFSFQGLTSSTEYTDEMAEDFDQPTGTFDGEAFRLVYRYGGRTWNATARYVDLDAGFRADMGFVPQVDFRQAVAGLQRFWHGDEDDWYSRIEVGGDWDRAEDQSGQLLEEEWEIWAFAEGPKQSFGFFNIGTRDRFFDGVDFSEEYVNLSTGFSPSGSLVLGLDANFGDDIDFANTRPGERLRIAPNVRWEFGRHLRTVLSHDYRDLDVEGGRLFEANLTRLNMVFQFNRRTFVRLISQLIDIERDPSLYIDEVDSKSTFLLNQLLFSYKLNPRTVLFLGYSDGYEEDQSVDLTQENRTLFFKVGYAWVL